MQGRELVSNQGLGFMPTKLLESIAQMMRTMNIVKFTNPRMQMSLISANLALIRSQQSLRMADATPLISTTCQVVTSEQWLSNHR